MIRILSIDGGGIRGIVPLWIIYIIEKRTGIPAYKLFDIITGTSTGSIIAAGLSIGVPAERLIQLYLGDEAKKIFSRSFLKVLPTCPKYNERNIEEVLQGLFEHKTIGDTLTGLIIPADDWANRRGRIFSSFEDRSKSIELWEVVRASSAAETFFRAFKGMFDGGLYANNPTDLAIREAIKYGGVTTLDQLFILSLGTGTLVECLPVKEVESMGYVGIVKNLIPEVMDRITSKTHDVLKPIFEMTPITNYFRLQFDCPGENESMDDVSNKNLQGLKNLADQLVCTVWKDDLINVVSILKKLSLMRQQSSDI